jgi:hypothetical protein
MVQEASLYIFRFGIKFLPGIWRNSCPILAEVDLPRLQSEIKVAMFLFASHSFLVNNLRFMIKLIDKTIVINGKIHKNKRKRFIQALRRFHI